MLHWLIQNAGLALMLAGIVWAISRTYADRATLGHVLWFLVLVRLVLPEVPLPSALTISMTSEVSPARSSTSLDVWEADGRLVTGSGMEERMLENPLELYGKAIDPAVEKALVVDESNAMAKHAADVPGSEGEPYVREDRVVRTNVATWVDEFPEPEKRPSREASVARSIDATSGHESLGTLILWCWALGAAFFLAFHLRRTFALQSYVVRRSRQAPRSLRLLVREVASRLGVHAPRVVVLPGLGAPFVWSFGRPTLVWPAHVRTGEVLAPTRTVLAHELAHIARRDHWTAWFEIVVGTFFYWNPIYWIARRHVRRFSELASDALVVRTYPNERRSYAEALIDTAERVSRPTIAVAALGATSVERKEFETRLTRIMRPSRRARWSPALLLLPLALGLSLLPRWSVARTEAGSATVSIEEDALRSMAQAERARREGTFHFEKGDWERVIRALAPIVERFPADGESQARLGIALMNVGRERDALRAYERQIEAGVRLPAGYYNQACAHARLGDRDAAFTALRRACEHGFRDERVVHADPDLAALRDDVVRFAEFEARVDELASRQAALDRAFAAADWPIAITQANRAIELAPLAGHYQHLAGYASIVSGDAVGAEVHFTRQLELGFLPHFATYNLACATARQGRLSMATHWLSEALVAGFQNLELLRTDPDLECLRAEEGYRSAVQWLEAQHAMSERLQEAARDGRYDELAEGCRSILGIAAPGTSARGWALHHLGLASLRRGDAEAATVWFARQVEDGYRIEVGLYGIACACSSSGNVDRAIAYLGLAIDAGFADRSLMEQDADLERARRDPAFERLQQRIEDRDILGTWDAASWEHLQEMMEFRLETKPQAGELWHRLGWALIRQGRHAQAAIAFERQAETGYSCATALYNVACCHALQGRTNEAFPWLERAAEAGKISCERLKDDVDLQNLRCDPRFAAIVRRLEAYERG